MSADLIEVAEDSARGSFFLATGNILSTIVSAGTTLIVARLLGADLYGVYSVSLVVPSLLLLFADFGIDQGLIRFSANLRTKNASESLAKMLRYGLFFKVLFGTAIFCMCFVLSDYLATYLIVRPDYALYIRLASISIIFQVIFNTACAVFVGFNRMGYNAVSSNVHALVRALVSPLLVLLGFSVAGAITGFVVSYLVAGLFAACLLFIKLYRPLTSSNREEEHLPNMLKTLLNYGLPLYVSALLLGFTNQLQTIILAIFTSDAEIGNFKASLNFTSLLTMLALPVATALFPAFSKLDTDRNKAKTFFAVAIKYTSLLIIPVATLIIMFSKDVVQVIYGETFVLAPLFLSIQASLFFIVGLGSLVQGSFFNGLGETRITFRINLIYFVCFVLLAPLLAQAYSVVGLIITLILCSLAARTYGLYLAKSKFDASPNYRTLIRIYIVAATSAIPALAIVHIIQFPPLIKVVLGGVTYLFTYLTLIPLARIIRKSELDNLQQVTRNTRILGFLVKLVVKYEKKILAAL